MNLNVKTPDTTKEPDSPGQEAHATSLRLFYRRLSIIAATIFILMALIVMGVLIRWPGWSHPMTLLVLGSDARHSDDPSRSDVIMVLRADPQEGVTRGLSIPRDLFVPLSGLPIKRTARINAALFYGDYYLPHEGLHAVRETVGQLLGIPVDGVIVVNFKLVQKLVDALGGVEIYLEKPIYDRKFQSPYGGRAYTLRFESGWNFLDGKRAMELIRVRRPDTDFGRQARNRQLLSAVSAELHHPSVLTRLTPLLPQLKREINTDFGPVGWLRTLWVFNRSSSQGIVWDAIDKSQTVPYKTPKGAEVLLPSPGILDKAGARLTGLEPLDSNSVSEAENREP